MEPPRSQRWPPRPQLTLTLTLPPLAPPACFAARAAATGQVATAPPGASAPACHMQSPRCRRTGRSCAPPAASPRPVTARAGRAGRGERAALLRRCASRAVRRRRADAARSTCARY
eukprot:scaffold71280_cov36-Phaeocystis_antarctica.AAC.1